MAAYPDFPQLIGSRFDGKSGKETKRATSGKPRTRTRFSKVWREGVILHELSDAQLATLVTFYDDNDGIPFTFTSAQDGVTYNVEFVEYPQAVAIGGGYHDVEVALQEV